jgi:hypothetical protein
MALEDIFAKQIQTEIGFQRLVQNSGGIYADPYSEIATIFATNDPKKLGRVKVVFSDSTESEWIYVLGQGRGELSTQYVGAKALISKSDGNSEDCFVVGIFNTGDDVGIVGSPIQVSVLDEQSELNYRDPGMKCNEGNLGRMFIGSNEISQDLKICVRRTNNQEDVEKPEYMWKSLTHGEMIEKGFDPGVEDDKRFKDLNKKKNRGVPKCTKALAGEIREFTEDRNFRRTMMVCRRDENGEFGWIPVSAPPTYFKTTLPDCKEKIHGMEAVVDDGVNSELVVCMRYQGSMKWIKPGKREPLQFHKADSPLSKTEFLDTFKPVEALQEATPASSGFLGIGGPLLNTNVLDGVLQKVNPLNAASSPLGAVSTIANNLPGTFNGADALSNIAKTVIANNANLSAEAVIQAVTDSAAQGGVIGSDLQNILNTLGGAAQPLITGAQNGTMDQVLEHLGKQMLGETLSTIDPRLGSVFNGYLAGGAQGAIDSAILVGANQLPDEISKYVGPLAGLGSQVLNGQPIATQSIINAALGAGSAGLQDVMGNLVSIGSQGPISPQVISNVASLMTSGELGDIAKSLGSFTNLEALPKLLSGGSLPNIASTALGLLGQGGGFTSLIGGGIGGVAAGAILGSSPVAGVLAGVPALRGLFGGGIGGALPCPCDPKCRKTEHGVDADGNKLLDPCGNVVASGAGSYMGGGSDPAANNQNPVAELIGKENSGIGGPLTIGNNYDLTELIKNVDRLNSMADKMEQATFADSPEFMQELMYTFEAIEKATKQADNNITKVESIERKLIDAVYRILKRFFQNKDGILPTLIRDVREQAKAIQDLYKFTQKLDAVKNGGSAGVNLTGNIAAAIQNIRDLQLLLSLSRKEALETLNGAIRPADREWRTLNPGLDNVNLGNIILGNFNPEIPEYFDLVSEGTKRNKDRILSESLASKINSPLPPRPDSFVESQLSADQVNLAKEVKVNDTMSLLDQIKFENTRSAEKRTEC